MINIAKLNASKNDECYTPADALPALIKHLPDWVHHVWCPCDKPESEIVKALKLAGKDVINTHIDTGHDFLQYEPALHYDMIITNPPYSNKDDFICRCVELGKPYALLLPLDSLCGKRRREAYKSGAGVITLANRRDFTGKGKNWFYNAWVCSWSEINGKWVQED